MTTENAKSPDAPDQQSHENLTETTRIGAPRATGSVKRHRGHWTARITFTIDGRRHETRVRAANRGAATDLMHSMLAELRSLGPKSYLEKLAAEQKSNSRANALALQDEIRTLRERVAQLEERSRKQKTRTFGALAEHYKSEYACPVEYHNGKRSKGIATWQDVRGHIDTLLGELGKDLPLSDLTFERVRAAKLHRLSVPIKRKGWKREKSRSFANVNRMLAVLRRMVTVAIRHKWMTDDPFMSGASMRDRLIALDQENDRERVLSPTEEKAILAKLEKRSVTAVLMLLDLGVRAGEVVRADKDDNRRRPKWSDVNFAGDVITVYGSKTEKERHVGLTPRLKKALLDLRKKNGGHRDAEILDYLSYTVLRNDFRAAAKAGRVKDIRIHDLRHTRATRWIQGGLNESEVAYLLGHSKKSNVTRRYINPNEQTIARSLVADAAFAKEHGTRKRTKKAEAVN